MIVGEDVAIAYGFHHFVPTPADHPLGANWMRVTVGFHKSGGKWRVVHEHVSTPFDPMTGKAEMIANP